MDEWQTMLAGLGAIIAAGVSIYYLRQQIAQGEAQEVRRRARRLAAARARMPLSLSDTANYASETLQFLKHCLDGIAANGDIPAAILALARPTVPEQAILSFEALIEATDDDEFAAVVASMIAEMQVLNSRVRGIAADAPGMSRGNIEAYIMNAAKVYGYASSMFEYARRETDFPPHSLDWDSVFAALPINEFYREQYPDLHAFIGRARDRAVRPEQAG